jgi:hypothetical protein
MRIEGRSSLLAQGMALLRGCTVALKCASLGVALVGCFAWSAAADDPLLREAVEFTGAVIFFEHKVPGLVIGADRHGANGLGRRAR